MSAVLLLRCGKVAVEMLSTRLTASTFGVGLIGTVCLPASTAISQETSPKTELFGEECAACEIVAVPLVTLGDAEGPGMLEGPYNVVRIGGQGWYSVTGGPSPFFAVFDSSGRATHRVGRSGEGPGEFRWITEIAIDGADSVFAFDDARRLVSVFDSNLDFTRSFRFGFRQDGPALFVGTSLLINTGIHTGNRVGLPFHVLDRQGTILRSFGSLTGGVYRADMQDIIDRRTLALADSNSFWAARTNQYLIERWTLDGRLLETLHRQPPWFEAWWEAHSDAETPPVPRVLALEQVGDTLWVLVSVPGERWRSGVEPGDRGYRVTNRDLYYDAVVEAIDLKRGVVIASSRMPLLFDDLLKGGLAVRNSSDESGNPVVSVYRLEIHNPPQ